jgi:hypothetical protein
LIQIVFYNIYSFLGNELIIQEQNNSRTDSGLKGRLKSSASQVTVPMLVILLRIPLLS